MTHVLAAISGPLIGLQVPCTWCNMGDLAEPYSASKKEFLRDNIRKVSRFYGQGCHKTQSEIKQQAIIKDGISLGRLKAMLLT